MAVYTSQTRYTGMSGIDTESMVQAMMKAESVKYNNLKKTRQKTTWKQEAYVAQRNAIEAFNESFIDIAGSNSLRKRGTFTTTTGKVSAGGAASDAATVRASSSAVGSYQLAIEQLAQNDIYKSTDKVESEIVGKEDFDVTNLQEGDSINVILDGRTVRIKFEAGDLKKSDGTSLTNSEFVDKLNEKLETAFGTEGAGASKVFAGLDGGKLTFASTQNHTLRVSEGAGRASSAAGNEVVSNWCPDENAWTEKRYALDIDIGGETKTIKFSYWKTAKDSVREINDALRKQNITQVAASVRGDGSIEFKAIGSTEEITISETPTANIPAPADSKEMVCEPSGGLGLLGFGSEINLEPTSVLTTRMGIANESSNAFNMGQTMEEAFGISAGESFTINGVTISGKPTTVTTTDSAGNPVTTPATIELKDMTVREFMTHLNSAGAGVKLSYDSISENFKLESTSMGANNAIKFDNDAKTFLTNFKIDTDSSASHEQTAQDSIFSLNGQKYIRENNDVSVGGLSLTLKAVTATKDSSGQVTAENPVTVDVARDTTKVFDAIKLFVDAYNALIEGINGAVNQTRAKINKRDYYEPLTDDEREAMNESDIKLWETKAKQGILTRDSTLAGITSAMRSELYTSVDLGDGRKISLYEIGVTTSSKVSDQGKLVIDEEKLKAAIESRSDDIATLFAGNIDAEIEGLADKLNKVMTKAVGTEGSLTRKVGSDVYPSWNNKNEMYTLMQRQDDQLADLLVMLRKKEENYYLKFSRMEQAVTQSSSQMTYLQSMLG